MTVQKNTMRKDEVSDKILTVRRKIQDSVYIDNAIQRIAFVLSRSIVEKPKTY